MTYESFFSKWFQGFTEGERIQIYNDLDRMFAAKFFRDSRLNYGEKIVPMGGLAIVDSEWNFIGYEGEGV